MLVATSVLEVLVATWVLNVVDPLVVVCVLGSLEVLGMIEEMLTILVRGVLIVCVTAISVVSAVDDVTTAAAAQV